MNISIALVSLGLTFLALEIAVRIYKKEYRWENYLTEHLSLFRSATPAQFDAGLGWIPKPGYSSTKNAWGTKVTLLEHGIRANGSDAVVNKKKASPVILAVGDSFTFGAQVSDHETWPAILENFLGAKVINGGVFGYGLDQTFLRAKSLLPLYHPDILIVSFILDDLNRCNLSERSSAAKPYFEISQDNKLVLKNVPVPQLAPKQADIFRNIFGYSALTHRLMSRLAPQYWLEGVWAYKKVHAQGDQIACLLLEEIDELASEHHVNDVYILVQYFDKVAQNEIERIQTVLNHIDAPNVHVVDLKQALAEVKALDRKKYGSFFQGHLTYAGNYFVAQQLKESIVKNSDLTHSLRYSEAEEGI